MKKTFLLVLILLIVSCQKKWIRLEDDTFERNFDTPQGAVLCLEDAYRSKDIDKVLSCRDFKLEALYMYRYEMEGMIDKDAAPEEEIVNDIAVALEKTFFQIIDQNMEGEISRFDDVVESEFPRMKKIDGEFIILEEVRTYKDGSQPTLEIIVGKKDSGWRMVIVEPL